jgi:hypothetical protein
MAWGVHSLREAGAEFKSSHSDQLNALKLAVDCPMIEACSGSKAERCKNRRYVLARF